MEIDGLLPPWARNFSSPPNKLTELFTHLYTTTPMISQYQTKSGREGGWK